MTAPRAFRVGAHSVHSLHAHVVGASSRKVRAAGFPEVTRRLWGRHFGSASYCVVSCGGAPLAAIAAYVRSQAGAAANPAAGGASPPR